MSRFHTVEVSDPRFERDNLRFVTVKSAHLKGRADCSLFVPPGVEEVKDCPLVILLHGVYGSAWSWPLKTGLHIRMLEWMEQGIVPPMVMAMPSDGLWGDGSGYMKHGPFDAESWIADDVPALVRELVPAVTEQSPLFITGLSMGGYGALRLGVKYHDRFRAIAAHSSITRLAEMALFVEEDLSAYRVDDPAEEDLFLMMEAAGAALPPIYFDCGTDDILIEGNRLLHKRLSNKCIKHIYAEWPGSHEWAYWERNIIRSLEFFGQNIFYK